MLVVMSGIDVISKFLCSIPMLHKNKALLLVKSKSCDFHHNYATLKFAYDIDPHNYKKKF